MLIDRDAQKYKWVSALTGAVIGAGLGLISYHRHHAPVAEVSAPDGAYCESGIGAARRRLGMAAQAPPAAASTTAITQTAWIPKINSTKPPGPAPAGIDMDSWRRILDGDPGRNHLGFRCVREPRSN
jgi:hypothetical protein